MSRKLFYEDPYLTEASGTVIAHTKEGGVVLDASLFYPTGGGQSGDSGQLLWPGGAMQLATSVTHTGGQIALVPAAPHPLPAIGTAVEQRLDWGRRYRHMRMHTALHLLSVVLPLPVTGGRVGETRSRLDFDMPEAPADRDTLEAQLNMAVEQDLAINESWITEAELADRPELVKTLTVAPPKGSGRIRLIGIGTGRNQIDLQPCGGTHVARTGEIGRLRLGKVEKKGHQNRRVYLHLDD